MREGGLDQFIGYLFIFVPGFLFVLVCVLKGVQSFIEEFNAETEEEGREKRNFFHHHYHYKAKRD